MKAPLTALTLCLAAPLAAQEFAGVPGLADSLASLRFTQAPPTAVASVPGKPVAEAAPDVSAYPVRGADVSTWQKEIDWDKLAGAGLSFVYIKATEGSGLVDDQFKRNWAGASRAGLLKGAYHFWDFCEGGNVQAANFIRTVPKEAGALPPTIDIEQSRGCRNMPSKQAFQKSLAVFLTKVEKAYGLKPVLYINASIYEKYLAGADHGLKLWISDPHDQAPRMPDNTSWEMWQYSFKGSLPGIGGAVDLDVFRGTPEMLAGLTQPDPTAAMYAFLR